VSILGFTIPGSLPPLGLEIDGLLLGMKDRVLICSEWLTHQHRDTLASIVGHPPLLAYISIADGECLARERFEVIEVS